MRKRRNVEEVETGELLNELSLRSFLDPPSTRGHLLGLVGAGPRLPRLSFQHPNSFCGG